MNVYYELADCIVDPAYGKYFASYDLRENTVITNQHSRLMQNSERAWAEDDYGIRYLKNRREDIGVAKVDMKEFFWIKLRSVTV